MMRPIIDCTEFEEILITCSLWNLVGSRGVQGRVDGGSYKYHSDSEFGGPKEHKVAASNVGTYEILQEIYQSICLDYPAHGESTKEGHHILLG